LTNSSEFALFVNGFDWQMPESELLRLFQQVGDVIGLKVTKQADGSPAAIITMSSMQDAEDAILKYDGTNYRSVILRVRKVA